MAQKYFGAAILLLAALASSIAASARAETLLIGGTGAALGTMRLLGQAFARERPDTSVEVLPSLGSSGGIKALLAGAIDLAVTARPLKDNERVNGIEAVAYGKTALVFAVSSRASQRDVTTDDLTAIFNGTRLTWRDGTAIRPVLRPEVETDTKLIKRHISGMDAALAAARNRPAVPVFTTDQETAGALERIPGAVGTASLSLILAEQRPLRALSLNGIVPTVQTIADGSYPMTKTFYFVTYGDARATVKRFIAFARSREGTAVLQRTGHVVFAQEAAR